MPTSQQGGHYKSIGGVCLSVYFLNFGTPSVTFERVKLDTSFFLYFIGHGEYYPTGDEWPIRGRGQGHVTYFLIVGPPL